MRNGLGKQKLPEAVRTSPLPLPPFPQSASHVCVPSERVMRWYPPRQVPSGPGETSVRSVPGSNRRGSVVVSLHAASDSSAAADAAKSRRERMLHLR